MNRSPRRYYVAAAIVVGYVLSPGLIAVMDATGHLPQSDVLDRCFEVFYWPLTWCYDNVEWVEVSYDRYSELLGV